MNLTPRATDDLFDAIAKNLLTQAALITGPGKTDPRWPAIIAQAYREGLAALAAKSSGGILFRMAPDGMMEISSLDADIRLGNGGEPASPAAPTADPSNSGDY